MRLRNPLYNCIFCYFQKYEEFVIFDAPTGSFSKVDVDAVDLKKYPGLAKAPWWQAKMQAGDCLFIPKA